jgi:phosphomannomutase
MSNKTLYQRYPNVQFGTSGVRALISDLQPTVIDDYVKSFILRMVETGALINTHRIAVGIDLRPSSSKIASTVIKAIGESGYKADYLGALPTPALASHCLSAAIPGVMVTGSHIPFDRNGLKFYSPTGEILKADEQAISGNPVDYIQLGQSKSNLKKLPNVVPYALSCYEARYIAHFQSNPLNGARIGVYQHSAVGRDTVVRVLESLGATVVPLGRSNDFVPVDTEAVSKKDIQQAKDWCTQHKLDALVSTDGDSDRPLVFDEKGQFIRGDILGLICARYLKITTLAVPVSCNTSLEKSGCFTRILRTRIGSPYVIEAMDQLRKQGEERVAGFEANGGFLLGSNVAGLPALPTRDALLPIITILVDAASEKQTISQLVASLPARYTYSNRIKDINSAKSANILQKAQTNVEFQRQLFPERSVTHIDTTDGVRITFTDGDIAHLRASGNAPELRCYTEADTVSRAEALCQATLERLVS